MLAYSRAVLHPLLWSSYTLSLVFPASPMTIISFTCWWLTNVDPQQGPLPEFQTNFSNCHLSSLTEVTSISHLTCPKPNSTCLFKSLPFPVVSAYCIIIHPWFLPTTHLHLQPVCQRAVNLTQSQATNNSARANITLSCLAPCSHSCLSPPNPYSQFIQTILCTVNHKKARSVPVLFPHVHRA